jgi:hypothetical protein
MAELHTHYWPLPLLWQVEPSQMQLLQQSAALKQAGLLLHQLGNLLFLIPQRHACLAYSCCTWLSLVPSAKKQGCRLSAAPMMRPKSMGTTSVQCLICMPRTHLKF